jgi:predicted nucleic acid-binding protein
LEIKAESFLEEINNSEKICVDSSILIYHLEDIKPYNKLTKILIREIAKSWILCNISALTITELLTKPYILQDAEKIRLFEDFIKSLPNTSIQAIDYGIAKMAASIRADYNLKTPDSLILATALQTGSQLLFTNDIALKKVKSEKLRVIIFDEYLES